MVGIKYESKEGNSVGTTIRPDPESYRISPTAVAARTPAKNSIASGSS
jgi:hypothetical protein